MRLDPARPGVQRPRLVGDGHPDPPGNGPLPEDDGHGRVRLAGARGSRLCPAGQLLTQVAAPIEFATDTPPFKRLDVVLVNHWAFALTLAPARRRRAVQPAQSLDARADRSVWPRAVTCSRKTSSSTASSGCRATRSSGTAGKLSINGTAVSWKPLLSERLPSHLEITVPDGPLPDPADDIGGSDPVGGLRVVLEGRGPDSREDILGGVYLRLKPSFTILVHPLTTAGEPADQTGRRLYACHGSTDLNLMMQPERAAGWHRSRLEMPAETERDADGWLRKADDHRRRGLYENSLRYYSRALEFDKSLVAGWVGQVQMLVLLGEYPEAELWATKVAGAVQEPRRPDGRPCAGPGADRRPDAGAWSSPTRPSGRRAARPTAGWSAASCSSPTRDEIDRHCFDKAVQADRDWLVPLEIALIYLHHEQPSKALLRARQAVEKAPERFYAWFIQGQCEQALGFDRQAKISYERCLELSPRHVEASRQARRGRQPGLVAFEGAATLDRPLSTADRIEPTLARRPASCSGRSTRS